MYLASENFLDIRYSTDRRCRSAVALEERKKGKGAKKVSDAFSWAPTPPDSHPHVPQMKDVSDSGAGESRGEKN